MPDVASPSDWGAVPVDETPADWGAVEVEQPKPIRTAPFEPPPPSPGTAGRIAAWEALNKPFGGATPRVEGEQLRAPTAGVATRVATDIGAAGINLVNEVQGFFRSPLGLSTLASSGLGLRFQKLIGAAFAGQVGYGEVEVYEQLKEAIKKGDTQGMIEGLGHLVGIPALLLAGGRGVDVKARTAAMAKQVAQAKAPATATALAETAEGPVGPQLPGWREPAIADPNLPLPKVSPSYLSLEQESVAPTVQPATIPPTQEMLDIAAEQQRVTVSPVGPEINTALPLAIPPGPTGEVIQQALKHSLDVAREREAVLARYGPQRPNVVTEASISEAAKIAQSQADFDSARAEIVSQVDKDVIEATGKPLTANQLRIMQESLKRNLLNPFKGQADTAAVPETAPPPTTEAPSEPPKPLSERTAPLPAQPETPPETPAAPPGEQPNPPAEGAQDVRETPGAEAVPSSVTEAAAKSPTGEPAPGTAEAEVAGTKTTPEPAPRLLADAEKWADKTIREGKKRLHLGVDPELMAAYIVKGAALLEKGVVNAAEWSAEMVKQLGKHIEPWLDEIRAKSEQLRAAPFGNKPASGAATPYTLDKSTGESALPKVNESTSAATPPPLNSIYRPDTPPGSDPDYVYAVRAVGAFKAWWEKWWPRDLAVKRVTPDSPVITEVQRLIESDMKFMLDFSKQPWWKGVRERDEATNIELEDGLVKGTLKEVPADLQAVLDHRESRIAVEKAAMKELAIDEPKYISGPYIARLTSEAGEDVVNLKQARGTAGQRIRSDLGSFEESREHPSMKDGIAEGTKFEPMKRAIWMRELVSSRLEATADMLRALKGVVLFNTRAEALKASPTKQVAKVRSFGGKDYWSRTREEAIFLDQNLNLSPTGPLGRLQQLINTYVRNPNLVNPLPHTTKNMFFKYLLARVGNATFKRDTAEFKASTPSQLRERFDQVMPFGETGERVGQLTSREVGSWAEKAASMGLKVNNPSTRFIFAKADPAMRYSLWKSYVRKGMSDQAAANHVWLDLVRYDANSGGIAFWKAIPFNFFVQWRTGTFVTLAKQFTAHPVRTLLFVGAVEYLREIRQRKSGKWTHLPVDYIEAPLAEAIAHRDAKTVAAVAATTMVFGPGGGQAPATIRDVMSLLHNDKTNTKRVLNMFWGLSQLYNIPKEYMKFEEDGDESHLVNILTGAALGEHDALKYEPRRLMKWLPEWMPGMEKSALVKAAEQQQGKPTRPLFRTPSVRGVKVPKQ